MAIDLSQKISDIFAGLDARMTSAEAGQPTPTPTPTFTAGYTPPATTQVGRLISNPSSNAYAGSPLSAQIDILDGYMELEVGCKPDVFASSALYSHWASVDNSSANSPFLFGIDGATLRLATFANTGDVFRDVRCTVPVTSYAALGEKRVFKVVVNVGSTTINGMASGTAKFYTGLIDANGITGAMTQIGATITGLSTGGIGKLGPMTYPSCGTLNTGNSFTGSWYYAKLVRSNGTIISNPDFRVRSLLGRYNGTFVDQSNSALTWTINGAVTLQRKLLANATYPRLKAGGSLRVKVLELLPPDGYWGHQWRDYASVNMDARIAYAAAQGYNAVKITSSGDPSEYPSNATMEPFVRQFYASCRARGLMVLLNTGHAAEIANGDGSSRDTNVARIAAHVALHMNYGYDRIVYMDVCNEIQFGFGTRPSTWAPENSDYYNNAMLADLAYLKAALKDVAPDVPMSESIYLKTRAMIAGDQRLLIGQELSGCDLHDCHPYFGKNGSATVASGDGIQTGDIAPLTSASFFLGAALLGECGIRRSNGDATRTSWWTGYGQAARDSGVLGAVVFGDQDFTAAAGDQPGTTDYGVTGDAVSENAIALWPTPA